jgi:hypothetical protein
VTDLTPREQALAAPLVLKEVGSPEWCWQVAGQLSSVLRHVDEQWREAREILATLKEHEAWKKIPPDAPYGSFNALVEREAGVSLRTFRERIKQASTRERDAADRKAQRPVGTNQHSEGVEGLHGPPEGRPTGRSIEAALRRLRKEEAAGNADAARLRGEVLAERMSAEAAMEQLDLWAKRVKICIHRPDLVAAQLRKHMTATELIELRDLLNEETPDV